MSFRPFLLVLAAIGCGGSLASPPIDAGINDHNPLDAGATRTTEPDSGCAWEPTPRSTYPGPHPTMPQVVDAGGPVLSHPRFVPIVFAGDARMADITAFIQALGTSTYWTSIASEYGVGPASAAAPIVVDETPPASMQLPDVTTWLAGKLDGTHADFGIPDPSSVYVIYYPASTTQLLGYEVCQSIFGFHSQALAGTTNVAFAGVARCSSGPSLTATTSHELFEAATHPFMQTAPAYETLADAPWTLAEVGDLCSQDPEVLPSDVGYPVQRIWSNAASAAGRQPCLPADGKPFFQTMPQTSDLINDGTHAGARGLAIEPGQTRTVDLLAFSDMPTSGPWTVSVATKGAWPDDLSPVLCTTSAENGDRIPLTLSRPAGATQPSLVTITSQLGAAVTTWSFYVGE